MFTQSKETEKNVLIGNGLALEYTRDSPLFRQQLEAVKGSYSGMSSYVSGLESSFRELQAAQSTLCAAQSIVIEKLMGRSDVSSRCLFTNAFPELGDLAQNLNQLCDLIRCINDLYNKLSKRFMDEGDKVLRHISHCNESSTEKMTKDCYSLRGEYDSKLSDMLKSRKKATPEQEQDLLACRRDYELARFDLVSKVNENDRNKKVLLTEVGCDIFDAFLDFFREGLDIVASREPYFSKVKVRIQEVKQTIPDIDEAWASVRAKLEGEILGARPPPGSPSGALSPVSPRQHQGMPAYTAVLTTEVLSNFTRNASHYDTAHARDDGGVAACVMCDPNCNLTLFTAVYKQGYLFSWSSKYFGTRKRRWYRLYSTKLYYVKFSQEDMSCSTVIVADMPGSIVAAKPGDMPFLFSITPKGSSEIQFQAENEDEMVLWISAIRRCSVSAPGRPIHSILNVPNSRSPLVDDGTFNHDLEASTDVENEVVRIRLARSNVANSNVWRNPEVEMKLIDFLLKNNFCAECGSHEQLKWISTSIGITLCEACATVHRQLTWSVSKLKNIEFDEFPEWQVLLLHDELGNSKANSIWEKNIPEGWTKPDPHSPVEAKSSWVLAKYQWYGFVEELRIRSPEQLCEGIFEAVREGSVMDVMWWISLKTEINCKYPDMYGTLSPLHVAVKYGRVHTVAFLALNGADLYATDEAGNTPITLAASIEDLAARSSITFILQQIQAGEY